MYVMVWLKYVLGFYTSYVVVCLLVNFLNVLIPKGGGLTLTPDSDSAVLRAVKPGFPLQC